MPLHLDSIYTDSDGPSIAKEVVRELHQFDPSVRVTFSKFALDPMTGIPIEVDKAKILIAEEDFSTVDALVKRGNAYFVSDPRYYVWSQTPDGDVVLVKSIPVREGFDRRQIDILRQDRQSMERLVAFLEEKFAHQRYGEKKAKQNWRDFQHDLVSANASRIHDLIVNDKVMTHRDAKIMSYKNQGSRSTPGQVPTTDREAGWEKPDRTS
jgi:hypothetical protein